MRRRFDDALLALGRLDAVTSLLPNASLLLYSFVRKEAVLWRPSRLHAPPLRKGKTPNAFLFSGDRKGFAGVRGLSRPLESRIVLAAC